MPTVVLSNLERRAVGNLSIPRNADLAHVLRQDPYVENVNERTAIRLLTRLADDGLVVNLGEHDDLAKLAASLERHATAHEMPDEKARIYVERLANPGRRWRQQGDLWLFTDKGFNALQDAPVVDSDSRDAYLDGKQESYESLDVADLRLEAAMRDVEVASNATKAKIVDALIEADRDEWKSPSTYATSTAELERIIAAESRRVQHDAKFTGSIHDDDGGRLESDHQLANALLPEEFRHWAKLVSDAHEAETGERPRMPIAGGSQGYSDATELLVLAAETGGTAYGETSPTFVALVTVAITDADTGSTITEAGYTGYARKSVANTDFNSPASGAHTNLNAITFAACTAGSSTVIGFGRCVASTTGRLIRMATCTSTVVSTTNTPASFAAGAYSDTLD